MAFAFTAITGATEATGANTPEHAFALEYEGTGHLFETKVSVDMENPFEKWLAKIDIQAAESQHFRALGFDLNSIWNFDKTLMYSMMRDLDISVVSCKRIISAIETIEKDDHFDFLSCAAATPDEQFFWLYAALFGICTICVPTLLVWIPYRYSDVIIDGSNAWYYIILPLIALIAVVLGSTPTLSMHMATDTVQERSFGVQMKPLMESQFINIGIVSALLLTILVAALQADIPESGDPSSIIWVWYIILLVLGLYFSFASTMTCALMLVYISPLEGDAVENFISIMALYAGEPVTNLLFTVLVLMDSLLLWIGGSYGDAPFISCLIIMTFGVTRTGVVMQNLQHYQNPQIEQSVRGRRTNVTH
ncbi:hypothetical protein B484DRAFT_423677 [Ochromonadaceae sp. CCMP2298]|nr:hypothetical protein B484DRAFT_423677 [Ochromonadaceae sp. CCMP2298]